VKLIVGLGNPGPRYRDTYHNIGFEVVDALARRAGVEFGASPADALAARLRGFSDEVLIAKPLTFMNLSGGATSHLVRFYKIDPADLLVVVDDVALAGGRLRIRKGGSSGGHNGLKSIIECLGTNQFPRLRVGVGRGDPRRDLAAHVLSRVPAEERDRLRESAERAADAAAVFITRGIDAAMNEFNRDPAPGAPEPED
jgi:PTH1 family peptidyl-tRNA hydrolase